MYSQLLPACIIISKIGRSVNIKLAHLAFSHFRSIFLDNNFIPRIEYSSYFLHLVAFPPTLSSLMQLTCKEGIKLRCKMLARKFNKTTTIVCVCKNTYAAQAACGKHQLIRAARKMLIFAVLKSALQTAILLETRCAAFLMQPAALGDALYRRRAHVPTFYSRQ